MTEQSSRFLERIGAVVHCYDSMVVLEKGRRTPPENHKTGSPRVTYQPETFLDKLKRRF